MVAISERAEIAATADAVWRIVSDPLTVAECIPGATLASGDEPDEYRGSIRVSFGPTAVTFSGIVNIAYDDAGRRCTIKGRGRDSRGASNALAAGTVTVSGACPAVLAVDGSFDLSGPLEGFARAGGIHIARGLLADFTGNVEARVGAPAATAAPPPAPGSLGGFRLLWRTVRSWVGGLMRGRTAP